MNCEYYFSLCIICHHTHYKLFYQTSVPNLKFDHLHVTTKPKTVKLSNLTIRLELLLYPLMCDTALILAAILNFVLVCVA